MNLVYLNSKKDSFLKVADELKTMEGRDYLLILSGGKSLLGLYEYLASNFNFPFPQDIALTYDHCKSNFDVINSNAILIKNTGLLGRALWEKSNFHSILGSKISEFGAASDVYERKLLELFQIYRGRVVSITDMDSSGNIGGIVAHGIGIDSDKYVASYVDETTGDACITVTATCIMEHFMKNIILINTSEKRGTFDRIMELENDIHEFPILIFKNMPDVTTICYAED